MQSRRIEDRNERNYLVLAVAPPILVAVLFGVGIAKERQAAWSVRLEQNNLEPEQRLSLRSLRTGRIGIPFSHQSRDPWSRLAMAAQEVRDRLQTFSGQTGKLLVEPGAEWEQAEIVKKILEESSPVMESLYSLIEKGNRLVDGSVFVELLRIKMKVAVFENDHEQAMRTLEQIHRLAELHDRSWGYPRDPYADHRDLILQTLAFGFWQEPQHLTQLRSQVSQPLNLDERWNTVTEQQRAVIRASLDLARRTNRGWNLPYRIPGETEQYWAGTIDRAESKKEFDSFEHLNQINWLHEERGNLKTITITGIPFADCRSYDIGWIVYGMKNIAVSLADQRYQQQVTLTVIAIKQFQLDNDRWPRHLDELGNVGVMSSDWFRRRSHQFFYDVSPDNREAILSRPRTLQDLLRSDQAVSMRPPHERNVMNEKTPVR